MYDDFCPKTLKQWLDRIGNSNNLLYYIDGTKCMMLIQYWNKERILEETNIYSYYGLLRWLNKLFDKDVVEKIDKTIFANGAYTQIEDEDDIFITMYITNTDIAGPYSGKPSKPCCFK